MPCVGCSDAESVRWLLRQGVFVFFKLLFMFAISFCTFVICTSLVILPNLEQKQRRSTRHAGVHFSQQIRSGAVPADAVDPWGSNVSIKRIGDDDIAVVSRGRNMITPEDGFDSDDIWNSMSDPPHRQAVPSKRTQLLFVCTAAALPWLYPLAALLRERLSWNTTGESGVPAWRGFVLRS